MAKNKPLAVILSACVLSTLAYPSTLPCGEGLTYDCYNGPNNVDEMNEAVDEAVFSFQSVLQALGCSQFMNGAIISFQKVIQPLMGFLNMALRRGCNSEYCGFGDLSPPLAPLPPSVISPSIQFDPYADESVDEESPGPEEETRYNTGYNENDIKPGNENGGGNQNQQGYSQKAYRVGNENQYSVQQQGSQRAYKDVKDYY